MDYLLQGTPQLTYAPGEHVYFAGDPGDSIYLVRRGTVKLYCLTVAGQERILGIVRSGEFFGEQGLGNHYRRITFARALDEALVYRLNQEALLVLVRAEPCLGLNLILCMAERRRENLIHLCALMQAEPRSRVLTILLLLLYGNPQGDQEVAQLPRTLFQQDLANFAGLNRTTVSGIINDLRHERILGGHGRVLTIYMRPFYRALREAGLMYLEDEAVVGGP